MNLDEATLRKPEFRGGVPVTLADGQEWWFARPAAYFTVDDSEAGYRKRWNLGEGYDTLLDAYDAAESGTDVIRAELALARFLLLANYDLATGQLGELLAFGYGQGADPAHAAMREAAMAVAFGREAAPKP